MTSSASPTPAQDSHSKAPLWRRALKAVGWMLAGLVMIAMGWVFAQLLVRRPRPAMLFTYADMPPLPSQAENGWEILKNEVGPTGEPKRPDKDVAEICDAKATFEDRWARAEARAQKLADVANHEHTKNWIALVDKAAALPQFADACPIEFDPKCPRPLYLLALHQMQEAVVLHDAMSSRWDDAFARTARMIRVDAAFLPSGRSTLNQAIARAHVHRSVKLVEVLLEGAAREKERGPDGARLVAFAREIDGIIMKVSEDDMAPLRAVVAEYLFSVYAIDQLTATSRDRYGQGSTIFYDSGHTLEVLNERFEQYAAFARANGTGKSPEFPRKWNWFLRNPIGHVALDATRGPLENHIPTISRDRANFLKDRENLHKRLATLVTPQ